MIKEPSVLEYLQSLLDPRVKDKIRIPDPEAEPIQVGDFVFEPSESISEDKSAPTQHSKPFPWILVTSILSAFLAQKLLEPPASMAVIASVVLLFSMVLVGISIYRKEVIIDKPRLDKTASQKLSFNVRSFFLAMGLGLVSLLFFLDNRFTFLNLTLWLLSIISFVYAFWVGNVSDHFGFGAIINFIKQRSWKFTIDRWKISLFLMVGLAFFFRFFRLSQVPAEPFSDHAEKLLDVYDVLQGKFSVFFENNTGREFIQFYLTALLAGPLKMGLTFLSLKVGTVLIGLFALPFIYLIGKEFGGKRVGMFALFFASISYWLNIISRIGLRFPLYPAFAAPALYFFIRGVNRQNRNDFILSGLFLGLGLHGYSPFRIMPFAIVVGLLVYFLHNQSNGIKTKTIFNFLVLIIASVLVFIPLLGYTFTNPEAFSSRALTRLTGQEQPLTEPAAVVFIKNNLKAATMFNFDDGEVWVHSIIHRPALDVITAVFFLIGLLLLIGRYLKHRYWLDLYLAILLPILLLPSTLSLAFPSENPSLNRTGAAAIVVMVLAGYAMNSIYLALKKVNVPFSVVVIAALLFSSASSNYDLVFNQFSAQFKMNSWNTSDLGNVIKDYVTLGNDPNKAYVIPFPYWVDTRLVGIQAGYPTKDYALNRESISETTNLSGNKLFLFKEEDIETKTLLEKTYPEGILGKFTSEMEGKSFFTFTVQDSSTITP